MKSNQFSRGSGDVPGGNSGIATKAASIIDEQAHRGADAVSEMARRAADRVDQASSYVQQKGQWARESASRASEAAWKHPAYLMLAAGVCGLSLGFLLRGHWRKQ